MDQQKTVMDIIFNEQVLHYRTISSAVGRTRRRWKRSMRWFPGEQVNIYDEVERVYKESANKYGVDLFKEYARERKLNERMFYLPPNYDLDLSYIERLEPAETTSSEYGRFKPFNPCETPETCPRITKTYAQCCIRPNFDTIADSDDDEDVCAYLDKNPREIQIDRLKKEIKRTKLMEQYYDTKRKNSKVPS